MPEYSYNPATVNVVVIVDAAAGLAQSTFTLHGFAEGTFIRAARSEATWTKRVSSDGEVATRSKRNNRSGSVTVILEEGSDSNALLDALEKADDDTDKGLCTVTIKDNSGLERFVLKKAYITQPPDVEKSAEAGTREWVFDALKLTPTVAGLNQV